MPISVRRWDLAAELDPRYRGLVLEVAESARSALMVQIAPPELLRIQQSGTTLISARIESGWYGVNWVRHRPVTPVIAPITSAEAEQLGADLMRWAHHFTTALVGSEHGPLGRGRWTIRPVALRGGMTPSRQRDEVGCDIAYWEPEVGWNAENGYIDWGSIGAAAVLPLRHPSPPDSSRPKAFTKMARAAVLPPVLLWWVSGLDCWLVIDGHDRLTAALAANVAPPILGLQRLSRHSHTRTDAETAHWYQEQMEKADARGDLTDAAVAGLGEALANTVAHTHLSGRTACEPIPGGADEWRREARNHKPRWQPAWG